MKIDNSLEPLMPLIQYYDSRIMMTALRLGIFDQLAEQPQTSRDIAEANSLDSTACNALLELLAGKKLLRIQNGLFEVSELVRENLCGENANLSPLKSSFLTWSKFWDHLEKGIRTGKSVSREAVGVEPTEVWESLQMSSSQAKIGMQAIHHRSVRSAPSLGKLIDWNSYDKLADLGAGSGCMSEVIIQTHATLRSVLVDLPETVLQASKRLENSRVVQNLEFKPGNLFDASTLPKDCDVYLLSWILHDWADEEALKILKNCFEAMPSGSDLVIFENFVENSSADTSALCSLSMSLYFGSKERTVDEYTKLLESAGFTDIKLRVETKSRGCLIARKS